MGFGASLGSPCGAPLSTHFTIVSISVCLSDLSLVKCPNSSLANQGGIFFELTAFLIALAHGRVVSYVSSDIGAVWPGRWQPWQCCWKIGRTSFVNMGSAAARKVGNSIEIPKTQIDGRSVLLTTVPPGFGILITTHFDDLSAAVN